MGNFGELATRASPPIVLSARFVRRLNAHVCMCVVGHAPGSKFNWLDRVLLLRHRTMCDRELDGSSSSLSSAELTLSSNAELGDVESASEPRVVSMLSYLKPPQASTLARKRKIASNPPKGMKRSKGVGTNDPKSVCPSDRVKAYPLTVSNKHLVHWYTNNYYEATTVFQYTIHASSCSLVTPCIGGT